MDVPYRLAGTGAGVEDDPVTVVGDTLRDCNVMGVRCDGSQEAVLGHGELGQIGVMRPRDNEHVNWCLRIDIAECDGPLVTGHYRRRYFGGSDGAKQAVRHAEDLNVCQVRGAADIYGCTTANPRCTTPLVQRPRQLLASVAQGQACAGAVAKAWDVSVGGSADLEASGSDEQTSAIPVMTAGEPSDVPSRPIHVTETLVADVALGGSVPVDVEAERAVTELYAAHYRSLVRLAALLVRDVGTAEEVVQDSFVAMHAGWRRLRDSDKALSYLRQAVVNRSRSVLRHRVVVDRNAPAPPPDMPSAEHGAIALFERSAVIAALRTLPARQREALVLRFYADMSEAQIADAMQISRGAVKSHTARAMQALRTVLERDV
jgi:RNA polymerase sigma-70 factor (sigma-E family)